MAGPMVLDIVTAERRVFTGEVTLVVAPGQIGSVGILPGHAPMIVALRPGELRLHTPTMDEDITLAIGGGFLEVKDNQVIVLAMSAERADEIDLERAQAARDRARAAIEAGEAGRDAAAARATMERAEARIRVAEGYRRAQGDQGR